MMYRVLLLLALLGTVLSGCGADWFPDNRVSVATFSFTPAVGVVTGSTQTSNPVTVSLITGDSAPISVSNGSYSINSETNFVTTAGTVGSGDVVRVRHTASATAGQTVTTTLTIGDKTGTFSSTTAAAANGTATVTAFSFTPDVKFGVTPLSSQVSEVITVQLTGGSTAPISVTGGEYMKGNSGVATSAAGTVTNGDLIVVRHNAADGTNATTVTTTLTIGDKSASFTTTTGNVLAQTVEATGDAGSIVVKDVTVRLKPGTYTMRGASGEGVFGLSPDSLGNEDVTAAFTDKQVITLGVTASTTPGEVTTAVFTIDGVPITMKATAQ